MLIHIRRSALCLVISILFVTGLAGQDVPTERMTTGERLLAFLTLKPVRDGFCAVNKTCPTAPAQPVVAQPPAPKLTKDEISKLYMDLQSLKDSKTSYLEALRLYVDGRKAHLSPVMLDKREDELRDQLGKLRTGLQQLQVDFEPLRVKLDFSSLPTSTAVDEYESAQSGRAIRASVIETLTTAECDQVYHDAVHNNVLLDQAIKNLADFIKNTYPDAGKPS